MKRQRSNSGGKKPKPNPLKPKGYLYQAPANKPTEIKDKTDQAQYNTLLSNAWGTSPGWSLLNGISVGGGPNERIGRKITMISLTLHWTAFVAPTSTQSTQIRIKAVWDRAPNSLQVTNTEILDANSFHAMNNLSNSERFITLCDFLTPVIRVSENFDVSGKKTIKMGLDAQYGGVGTSVTSINTGAIWLNVCQSGNMTTASPSVIIRTRVRFMDV